MHRLILLLVTTLAAAATGQDYRLPGAERDPAQLKSAALGTGSVGIPRIDAHVHVGPPPESFFRMLDRLDVRLLNVTLVDPHVPGFDKTEPQSTWAAEISHSSEGRIGWVTTFDPTGFENLDFYENTSRGLIENFGRGAIGVKIYKSIGMDLKSNDGRFAMPDDPAFAPVLELIERQNKTLVAHLAEPRSSWRPLDSTDPHYGYYKNNPDWHMFLHPERPSWENIIAARDRMLEAHPKLRVVGCHLGSMEHDVDEVARRFDRYPNFAVDTAARMVDLMLQPRDKVRSFLIRYQDRVLWGTDLMELSWENPEAVLKRWAAVYERDWKYLATTEEIAIDGRQVRGLGLPEAVLRKVFHDNALSWIPGLKSTAPDQGGAQEFNRREAGLPSAAEIVNRYLQALGGEEALRKITSRGAKGSFFVPSYGSWGSYQEFALAPNSLIRTFHVENYGVTQRCVQGETGWSESPEYGVEDLKGAALKELRLEAELCHPLAFRTRFSNLEAVRRTHLDGRDVIEVRGLFAEGVPLTLWFDAQTGLLSCVELPETGRNGKTNPVRMFYEDYRSVDGMLVAHTLRYVGGDLIWIVNRGVAHNLPLGAAPFRRPGL
jgi:hypothetical protein